MVLDPLTTRQNASAAAQHGFAAKAAASSLENRSVGHIGSLRSRLSVGNPADASFGCSNLAPLVKSFAMPRFPTQLQAAS